MLNFNENKVTINIFTPFQLVIFIPVLFMPNYLSFGCVFSSFQLILGLLDPDPQSECGSGSETLVV
jgi:hypothetical protein